MTQILEIRSWKWIRVCILLGFSVAHEGLANTFSPPTNTTTPTPASNYSATITSSGISASPYNQPKTITSCGSVNFTTYLQSSLQALPSAALEAYFASGYSRLNSDLANIERYANSPITDTVAFQSFLYAELSTVSADISSLFGAVGRGVLSFQNIASTDPCLFSTCLTSYLAESSALAPLYSAGVFDFVYSASPPCCGQCIVSASGVELAYWPTPAPTPPVSVLVDANNVSYVSPSVYVFMTSLKAQNLCGPVGGKYPLKFLSYRPYELSTSTLATSFSGLGPALGQWTRIDYADFDSPKCLCTTNCQYDSIQHSTLTNICTPQMSMPPGVNSIDPAWATCGTNLFGVFDPPIALTIQAGLTTPKNTPAQTTTPIGVNSSPAPPPITTPTSPQAETLPTPTTPIPPPTNPPGPTSPSSPTANPNPNPNPVPSPNSQPPNVPPPVNTPLASSNSGPGQGPSPANGVTTTIPPPLVINGQTITANSQGSFVVGTQTLSTNSQGNIVVGTQTLTAGGPAITVSDSTISLGPGATAIVFGGTSTTNLGSVIQSFVGSPPQYTGAAVKGITLGGLGIVWMAGLAALVI